jgi:hypothetical protein
MLFIRRQSLRNNRTRKASPVKAIRPEHTSIAESRPPSEISEIKAGWMIFAEHIAKYKGQTVTVFVEAGGVSGMGFTGVLIKAVNTYIELLALIGPAPACSTGSSCTYPLSISHYRNSCSYSSINDSLPAIRAVGSIVCIPVNRIASFVHNAV